MTETLTHPAWCDPRFCEASDRHWSRPLVTPAGLDGAPTFELRLFATVYAPLGADKPLVEVDVRQHDGAIAQAAFVEADVDELRWLHAALGAVLHVCTAPEPHLTELPEPLDQKGGTTA